MTRPWQWAGKLVSSILLVWGMSAMAMDMAPADVISTTADQVIAAIKSDKAIRNGDRAEAYKLIEQKVLPHFDFTRMTRLAVGRYWRQASVDQQAQLISGFRDLLVRTYSTSLSQYKDQVVQMKGTDLQDGDALVHTALVPSGGQPIPIDYSMEKMPDGWKVYDITVDGVSLVTNYRSEFGDVVRRDGVDGLIHSLDEKRKLAEKK